MNLRFISYLSIVLLIIIVGNPQFSFTQSHVTLEKGDLKAVFVDNSDYGQHRQGYNGISELYHKNQDSTLFVPFYAGFNLEHIFDGDSLISLFEPRREPMTLEQVSNNKIILHQPVTSISRVESWTTFEMVAPHYIDVEFSFVIHDASFFNHGYVGFFWASYINRPNQLGIYFKGGKKGSPDSSRWMYSYSDKHGKNATHVGKRDAYTAYMAPNFNVTLARGMSGYYYTEPYYYGRFHNMVFGYLFSEPDEGVIRMTQSPSGGGSGNPAWDFQYILPNFEAGKTYSFNTRVLYKEWISQKDIESEYKKWSKK